MTHRNKTGQAAGIRPLLVTILVVGLLGLVSQAHADPPGGGGKHMSAEQAGGGPPPWAPAHGYRRKHGRSKGGGTTVVVEAAEDAGRYVDEGHCNREAIGAVIGGVVGGVAGAQVGEGDGKTLATIAGTIVGVIAGKSIGRAMDEADEYCAGQALEYAPDGQAVTWQNPDTQSQYSVTPASTYQNEAGQYCREYVTEAVIDGNREQVSGTACRQEDGSWKL